MTEFVRRLQQAARFAGVGEGQSDIAEALGITRQRVYRWFRLEGEPEDGLTLEIARKFRVSADWLKTGAGDMIPPPGEAMKPDEKELIRYYRSATPQVRQVISTMVRAVRKSIVAGAIAIPPLLAPQPAEAKAVFNITFNAIHIGLRRWFRVLFRCPIIGEALQKPS